MPPTILLFAGSGSGLLGATFQAGGSWSTSTLGTDTTDFSPSLTVDSSGRGIGLYTDKTAGKLGYTVWSGNAWSTPAEVGGGTVSRAQPFLDATGGSTTYATYLDGSYDLWSLTFRGSTWSSAQALGPTADPYYGPVPAAIAALGDDALAAFTYGDSGNNEISSDSLSAGTWDAVDEIEGQNSGSFSVSPSIVALRSGPDALLVYVTQGEQVTFTTWSLGAWASPSPIAGCTTADNVALAPLPGGDAILSFRGTDGNVYWSLYSGGAWSSVAALLSSGSTATDTTPAVTHGIGTDVAELAFVSSGVAYASSLTGSTWSAPVTVGGSGLAGVALASTP